MARIRSIHPDACDSRKLGLSSSDAERLYWRLQTHCDDQGRCEDDPRLIWMRCCSHVTGWTEERVDGYLRELDVMGLLVRYHDGNQALIEIMKWGEYQHPQKPRPSKYGAPPMPLPDHHDKGTVGASCGGEGRGEGESIAGPLPDTDPVDNEQDVPLDVVRSILRSAKDKDAKTGATAP